LEDQCEAKDEDYNANNNNWIQISNQLEEGSHMLIEETIEIDLNNEYDSPKIIQLGKSLTKDERKKFITILKKK